MASAPAAPPPSPSPSPSALLPPPPLLALLTPPRFKRSAPPNGGYAWLVCFAAFLNYTALVGFMYVSGLFYNAWLLDADTFPGLADPRATLGLVNGVNVLFFLGASLAAGMTIARFGDRATLLCGAALVLAGAVGASLLAPAGTAAAPADGQRNASVLTFFVGVLMGSGASFAQMASMCGLMLWFTTRRGIAIGICVSGSGVGGIVLGPLLQAVIAASGWRTAIAYYGIGAALTLCMSAVIFVPLEDDLGGMSAGTAAPVVAAALPAAEAADAEPVAALTSVRSHDNLVDVGAAAVSAGAAAAQPPLTPIRNHDRLVDAAAATRKREGGSEALADNVASANAADWAPLAPAPAPAQAMAATTTASAMEESSAAPAEASAPSLARLSLRQILQVADFRWYALMIMGTAFAWFTVPAHMPRFVSEAGLSAEQAGALVAVQGVANAVGRVGFGALVDLMPRRKILMLRIVAASMSCAYLFLAILPTRWYAFVFMALSGLLGGSMVSLQPQLIVDILGERNLSVGQGLFNLAQAPFGLAAPPVGGFIRSVSGSYSGVWIFVAAATAVSAGATQVLMRPKLQRSLAAAAAAFVACGRGAR